MPQVQDDLLPFMQLTRGQGLGLWGKQTLLGCALASRPVPFGAALGPTLGKEGGEGSFKNAPEHRLEKLGMISPWLRDRHRSTSPPHTYSLSSQDPASLKPNLDAFVKATENFKEKGGSSISKNLRVCEALDGFWAPCLGSTLPF